MYQFFSDESGVTAIEYALIAALVAVGLILTLTFLGDSLTSNFDQVASAVNGGGAAVPM